MDGDSTRASTDDAPAPEERCRSPPSSLREDVRAIGSEIRRVQLDILSNGRAVTPKALRRVPAWADYRTLFATASAGVLALAMAGSHYALKRAIMSACDGNIIRASMNRRSPHCVAMRSAAEAIEGLVDRAVAATVGGFVMPLWEATSRYVS